MSIVLETPRLQLRHITTADAGFIYELVNSPGWHRFIGDRGVDSLELAERYIEENYLPMYEKHDFGAYIMIHKEEQIPIGSCGLYQREQFDHPDIGYALLPSYTRQGYAIEAAQAVFDMAVNKLGFETILAITTQDNVASIRLLKKLGMQPIDTFQFKEEDEELFLFSTQHQG